MEAIYGREELQMRSRNLDYAQIEQSLMDQSRAYCKSANHKGFIVGVSGGVDSAVVSTLMAKTGLPVLVVDMPIHQNPEEVSRAREHIDWLKANFPNVRSVTADLTEAFETFKKVGEQVDKILGDDVDSYMSLVNTRSRHRMEMLYYLGASRGLLVAGTGNKVEDYGIGFFTKHGDGGVDFSPIGSLYKSEVRALGRHMGILPLLTEAVATDGLHSNGATDEDQIGAKYPEVEWAMEQHEGFADVRAINSLGTDKSVSIEWARDNFTGRALEVMDIYIGRHYQNEHKMEMPPVFTIPIGK